MLLPAKSAPAKHRQKLKRGWTLQWCCWAFGKVAHLHIHACKDKDAYTMALQPLCVRMFPRMFWLPLSKRGILPGKLLLSKSPAVILTNEPWKSEEVCGCVCVCVCLYSHVCLRIRACGFLLVHKHSMCTIRMTYRWLVYKRISFFDKQQACQSLIDKNQKTVLSHGGHFLRTSFFSRKLPVKHF